MDALLGGAPPLPQIHVVDGIVSQNGDTLGMCHIHVLLYYTVFMKLWQLAMNYVFLFLKIQHYF